METALQALAYASVAGASLFYTWIWWRPTAFRSLTAPSDPSKAMAFWANVLKVLQIGSIALLTNWSAALSLPAWRWGVCLAFLAAGQHLNYLVMKLLGIDGVYYGVRFGKHIPWVHGYPYNTIKDPQYVGGILSCIGAAFVAPVDICVFWILNYFYLMWLERSEPKGKAT